MTQFTNPWNTRNMGFQSAAHAVRFGWNPVYFKYCVSSGSDKATESFHDCIYQISLLQLVEGRNPITDKHLI